MFRIAMLPVLASLIGCGGGDPDQLPPGILSQEIMIPILMETHLADAILDDLKYPKDSTVQYARVMHENIYTDHGTTMEEFERSIAFYKRNPEKLEAMYTELLKQMSIKEAEFSKSRP